MTNYSRLPGIPPNMSIHAAIAAGLLPINVSIANGVGSNAPGQSLAAAMAAGTINPQNPVSTLTFANPNPGFANTNPAYTGDNG